MTTCVDSLFTFCEIATFLHLFLQIGEKVKVENANEGPDIVFNAHSARIIESGNGFFWIN